MICCIVSFTPSPRALITSGTTTILYLTLLSLNSHANCLYLVCFSFLFSTMLITCGHAMSHIRIHFFSLSSSIRSGLLAVVVFRRLNSKSHTNLARAFSKTCPLVHLSLYHFTSFFTRWYSFAYATAITISALMCLVKYSLFAIFLHPASKCSTVSFCSLHSLHLPSSVSPLVTFHALVSTICSSIDIIEAVFGGVMFCSNHCCSCFL